MPEHLVLASPQEVARHGAELLLKTAAAAVTRRGRFILAPSGGSTPSLLYRLLVAAPYAQQMPWSSTHLLWGDERWVPHEHYDSNAGAAVQALISHVPIPESQVHPIPTTGMTPQESAAQYERVVLELFEGGAPRLDLALLGMGDDGHTASLFPGTAAVGERRRWVFANHVPSLDTWHITMTLRLLNASRRVLFLVTGASKAPALQRVFRPPAWGRPSPGRPGPSLKGPSHLVGGRGSGEPAPLHRRLKPSSIYGPRRLC